MMNLSVISFLTLRTANPPVRCGEPPNKWLKGGKMQMDSVKKLGDRLGCDFYNAIITEDLTVICNTKVELLA
jgi:hypothetical protein